MNKIITTTQYFGIQQLTTNLLFPLPKFDMPSQQSNLILLDFTRDMIISSLIFAIYKDQMSTDYIGWFDLNPPDQTILDA